jgi:(p)ppGpp synthase/HD superfamily hydrolase
MDVLASSRNLIADAERFAAERHRGQEYGNGLPYTYHLKAVADTVDIWTCYNPNLIAAAWLHDVLEDTPTTLYELEGLFGSHIATVVDGVTNRPGANRKERHERTWPLIRESVDRQIVKLADRNANMNACVDLNQVGLGRMYLQEWPSFKAHLASPPIAHLWNQVERTVDRLRRFAYDR